MDFLLYLVTVLEEKIQVSHLFYAYDFSAIFVAFFFSCFVCLFVFGFFLIYNRNFHRSLRKQLLWSHSMKSENPKYRKPDTVIRLTSVQRIAIYPVQFSLVTGFSQYQFCTENSPFQNRNLKYTK